MNQDHFLIFNGIFHAFTVTFHLFCATLGDDSPLTSRFKNLRQAARQKGYPEILVRLARSGFEHLTVITQLIFSVYFIANWLLLSQDISFVMNICLEIIKVVIIPSSTFVGVVFWALTLFDKYLIFPRFEFPKDDEECEKVLNQLIYKPNFQNPILMMFWIMLHQQHTLLPVTPWVYLYCYGSDSHIFSKPYFSLQTEMLVASLFFLFYLQWNFLMWEIRSFPPYPIQLLAKTNLQKLTLYGLQLVLYLTIVCYSYYIRFSIIR